MPVTSQPTRPTVDQHFAGRDPAVRAIYDRILEIAQEFGAVRQEPKKTSIHLARRSAFAGITTRKDSLILTIKSSTNIRSSRIVKREQVSAGRWHLDVRLENPDQADTELRSWLQQSFDLSG
jgi:hypothetical protein